MAGKNALIVLSLALLVGCSSLPRTKGLLECDTDKFQKQADVNLFNAAKVGDIQNLKEALSDKADLNAADRLGQTALMWAAWNGHEEIIQELVRHNDALLASKKKKSEPLKYSATSKEKYNALFCIVMSNSFRKDAAISCMELLLEKEPRLLFMTDQYNETCLHKAVRSGNEEYLTFFLDRLDKEKNKKMIDKKNSFSETPLILAVKLQQLDMVERLVKQSDINMRDAYEKSLPVIAFDGGKGNYNVFLAVMQEKLRRIIEEEKQNPKNSMKGRTYSREDSELFEALNAVNGMRTAAYLTPYYLVYNKIRNGALTPKELDDNFFREAEDKFFSIFEKNSLTQDDIRSVKEQLYAMPALMQSRLYDKSQDMKKPALQLCIESGNADLFAAVFKELKMNRVPPVASGCGNYLIYAILKNQPDIIKTLLDYNASGRACPQELMASYHTFSSDLSAFKTGNPVVQFLRTDSLRSNETLLKGILSYYKTEFSSNPNYAGQIFEAALNRKNDEKLVRFLIQYEGFYCIEKVFGGRPLQFELFEKGYFETLKLFIEHGNLKFDWKDTKNGRYDFETFLEKRIENKQDEKPAQEFLNLLREKGLDRESRILGGLRNLLP
ncbi:MAG: ankyrin repeat domain-containing protein [Treponemataceae bacterium]|nr:ankyrin repeat domain-containing protein [Treponemataceae bacterium]